MKSTIKIILGLIAFLLTHSPLVAQYNGGIADGSSLNISNNIVCSSPAHFYAYLGGSSDGESVHTLINTTCGFSPGMYAYTGGIADGNSVNTQNNTTCGFAPGQYAYMGGTKDGATVDTKMYGVCADPPQFYTYFGGSGDGSSMNKQQNCAIVLPVADFTGTPLEICVNQNVTFTDASTNAVGWEWTVTGGTFVSPSTMYSQNPVVKYATAGTYAVTLKARNQDGDNVITKTAYIKVNATATITATTPNSRCGAGSVTISATPNSGTIKWYNAATGGTLLFTGNSFTTPSISTSTTYYAEAFNGCTASTRTAVLATVNPIPTISGSDVARCGAGTVTLTANPSAGTVKWYDAASGGTELGTGTTYTTPSLTSTTSYYAETTSTAGCTSNRIEIKAIINEIPIITSTTPATRCGAGTATIYAVASAGTVNWYTDATGGSWLASGNSYSPSVSTSTTFYVGSTTTANCSSDRVAVTVTINPIPTITSTTPASRCGTGSVTLGATATGGTMSWFADASGGTALGTGTSFTTPSISSSTTYYVETDNGTCNSGRTAVTATVNNTAAPTGNSAQNFCPGQTLADLIVSGSNVQWYDAATNGNILPNSTLLISGQTYYATQTANSCESTTRLGVTATQIACMGTVETEKDYFRVYPNPAADFVIVEADSKIKIIEIYAMSGQKVTSVKADGYKIKVDMSNIPQSVYILKIFTDKETKMVKVIKK